MILLVNIIDFYFKLIFSILIFCIFFTFLCSNQVFAENNSIKKIENKKTNDLIQNLILPKSSPTILEIQNVIRAQIFAFKEENCSEAYSYASISIKFFFPRQKDFCEMVKIYYPMIWNQKQFFFLKTMIINGIIVQNVEFIDKNNDVFIFQYQMRKINNEWTINGVFKD